MAIVYIQCVASAILTPAPILDLDQELRWSANKANVFLKLTDAPADRVNALLSSGWTSSTSQAFQSALVPWWQ